MKKTALAVSTVIAVVAVLMQTCPAADLTEHIAPEHRFAPGEAVQAVQKNRPARLVSGVQAAYLCVTDGKCSVHVIRNVDGKWVDSQTLPSYVATTGTLLLKKEITSLPKEPRKKQVLRAPADAEVAMHLAAMAREQEREAGHHSFDH